MAAISIVIFVLARTIGARTSSTEAAVSRIARPGIAFWGETVERRKQEPHGADITHGRPTKPRKR